MKRISCILITAVLAVFMITMMSAVDVDAAKTRIYLRTATGGLFEKGIDFSSWFYSCMGIGKGDDDTVLHVVDDSAAVWYPGIPTDEGGGFMNQIACDWEDISVLGTNDTTGSYLAIQCRKNGYFGGNWFNWGVVSPDTVKCKRKYYGGAGFGGGAALGDAGDYHRYNWSQGTWYPLPPCDWIRIIHVKHSEADTGNWQGWFTLKKGY